MRPALLFAALLVAGPALAEERIGSADSVVRIWQGRFGGTGFVFHSDGKASWILTNRHVCMRADPAIRVVTAGTGREFAAEWLEADKAADLAVIKVAAQLPALPIADREPPLGSEAGLWGMTGGFHHGPTDRNQDGGTDKGLAEEVPIGPVVVAGIASKPGDSGSALTHGGKVIGVCRGGYPDRGEAICVRLSEVRRVCGKYLPARADKPAPAPAPRVPPAVSLPHAGELRAALADARRLEPDLARRTRYLTLYAVPAADRDRWRTLLVFWTNSLSREATLARPRRVTDTLFAVVLDDYAWDPKTWEKLADEDPYFHVLLDVGKGKVAALAPWLPTAEGAELVALTQSAAPIVRGDWWFSRAAIQFNRKGTGYYDWLGLKDLNAFDALVAFDRKKAQQVEKEVAAIVARSGVANFPRQVFREAALTGGRWETRDQIVDNKDERNALRQLLEDLKPAAFEIYGFLPNGLFVFFLADGQGKRQDSAPDGIGPDKTAPGNDGKIHVGLSCVRCHAEGLRPLNDWARRVYSGPLALTGADADVHRRLVRVYLGELQEELDADVAAYAKRLKRLTGWKPDEAAKAVGAAWAWYQEADLLPADVAAELGLDEAVYLARLRSYYVANKLADPVLASHLARPPIPIRRDDVEQLYPLLAPVALAEGPK